MSAILTGFLANPTIIAIFAAIIGALGYGFQQRLAGAKAERNKQAQKEAEATDIGHQVDNDIGAMTPAQAREALQKWSKH